MICPKCGYKAGTIDSRYVAPKRITRRRYECWNHNCQHRFTTYEYYVEDYDKPRELITSIAKLATDLNAFFN